MTPRTILDTDNEFFTATREDHLLVIREKPSFTRQVGDLRKVNSFNDYLDILSRTDEIRAVVSIGAADKTGSQESVDFIRRVLDSRREDYLLQRLFNMVNNYILALTALDKITVHADHGRVSLFHLTLSLAHDYRIVADDTVFENAFADLGLVAKGGAGYFMARMLGMRKATEVLQWSRFTAEEALHLGLVDRLVPAQDLSAEAVRMARTHLNRPVSTLFGIRKLLKSDPAELCRSLQLEDQLILSRINAPDFRAIFEEYVKSRKQDQE